jgi:two-component system, OmpR family, alkaline phosphatase synthesis response regulator PhoP
MAKRNILVVEDDPSLRMGIIDALEFKNFNVIEAKTGGEGMEFCLDDSLDLVLLDYILPEYDGFQILAHIRKYKPSLPVIMLTARGSETDKVEGLNLGADDYVVKPFSVKELLARVDAVIRRTPERPKFNSEISIPGCELKLDSQTLEFENGKVEKLSAKESEVLDHLIQNIDRIVSREELLMRVWKVKNQGIETRTVDMHIARIRDKINKNTNLANVLETIRSRGYRLNSKIN